MLAAVAPQHAVETAAAVAVVPDSEPEEDWHLAVGPVSPSKQPPAAGAPDEVPAITYRSRPGPAPTRLSRDPRIFRIRRAGADLLRHATNQLQQR